MVFSISEETSGVEMNYSGEIDLTGLVFLGSGAGSVAGLNSSTGTLVNQVGPFDSYVPGAPVSFGTGGLTVASSATGDVFGLVDGVDVAGQDELQLPVGYVSGAPISGSFSFAGASFTSLGLTSGTSFLNTLSNGDTIRIDVGISAAVPLLATLPLLLAGIGAIGWAARRRRT
ncbi:hypothetical protein [Jannaschia seohaensis]|uniref:hypothetical protein n=1 Tax=Jannaschia seohaensis TaxID=475081 RepID=UPI0011B21B55|nr:hypothetical protein [Jannaschia seohaensis]